MLGKLLKLDWIGFRRAPHWAQSMTANVFLGLFGLYMLISALGLGYMASFIIKEAFPGADVLQKFNGYFAIYLIADICMRFMLQKFPSFSLSKYLTINVKKSTITRYLMVKSLLSIFNLLPLFIIIPFYLTYVSSALGQPQALVWLLLGFSLILFNNYLSFFLDRSLSKKPLPVFFILASLVVLIYLDFKGFYSLSDLLAPVITALHSSVLIALPVLLLAGLCHLIFKHLRSNAYIDIAGSGPKKHIADGYDFGLFDFFGDIGRWMKIESKMIMRNKKSKSYMFMSFFFLVYPLIMGVDLFDNTYMLLIFAIMMVGAFMMNYGQLLFSWNSAHFDFIITQNIGITNFLKSKYALIAGSNLIFFILSTPYVFFQPKIVLVNFAILFFNAGVVSYFLLWFSMSNSKKMDVSKGAMFNYEGISAAHFLIGIPIIGVPLGFYAIFDALDFENLGLLILGIIGLLGVVFNTKIIEKASAYFNKKKYSLHSKFTK